MCRDIGVVMLTPDISVTQSASSWLQEAKVAPRAGRERDSRIAGVMCHRLVHHCPEIPCGPKVFHGDLEPRSQASQKPCGSKASVALLARRCPTELEPRCPN